ncbi:orotate phosphoribosyltransferase [Celerinatantimonas yamalensis]|uniref:Orotate phosphoribosyltransferase n=1 Tax=Celerinatantimonas yamalensis TaxID=559956 RepID=A0ABW9G3T8_9GAMM
MSIAKRIREISEIKGQFVLRSGKISDRYFDKYRFEAEPKLLSDIAQEMVKLIPEGTEVLCGLEMGGIPIVTMMSHYSGLPAAFIRKEPKSYGTCKYAEGTELAGKRIVLVEDVVSSGGAIIDATKMLRNDDIVVEKTICTIDRETGGKEKLFDEGVELIALLTATELAKA